LSSPKKILIKREDIFEKPQRLTSRFQPITLDDISIKRGLSNNRLLPDWLDTTMGRGCLSVYGSPVSCDVGMISLRFFSTSE